MAEVTSLHAGSWVRSERPSEEELAVLVSRGIDADLLADALDPHEEIGRAHV